MQHHIFMVIYADNYGFNQNTKNNAFVRGILGDQFRLEMMVPQTAKEAPKISEGLPVSSPVSIQEKEGNIKDQVSRNIKVELKKTVIHKC